MFIVLEGPDGSGKTTLAQTLTKNLKYLGQRVLYTFEPTEDNEYGCEIRRLLKGNKSYDPVYISDLMTADRRCHLETIILPAHAYGEWIVCDRYKYSALAYQQMQGVDVRYLIESNRTYLIPDVVFILRPRSVTTLLERIVQRDNQIECFENKRFLEGVMRLYDKMPVYFPEENIHFLDAELPIACLITQISSYLQDDGFFDSIK